MNVTHLDLVDFAEGLEVLADVVFGQVGGDAAHENLSDALTRRRLHDQKGKEQTAVVAYELYSDYTIDIRRKLPRLSILLSYYV